MRGLVAGLVTFAVYLLLQVGIFHFIKISRRALTLVGIWIMGLPVYALIYYSDFPEDAALWPSALVAPSDVTTLFAGGLLYFFLFMGYAQFIYMAESSVGVRTMIELAANHEKGLTLEEITTRYQYRWMLERRLERMIHAGYLIEEGGWYRTTRRGHLAAKVLAWFKNFLHLGPGG